MSDLLTLHQNGTRLKIVAKYYANANTYNKVLESQRHIWKLLVLYDQQSKTRTQLI